MEENEPKGTENDLKDASEVGDTEKKGEMPTKKTTTKRTTRKKPSSGVKKGRPKMKKPTPKKKKK